ncbi:MAG: hypothetical protein JWM87_1276 [Candidatus Eremiobacteraeota bacterium]|nr:hypothetical protein [Candidatus Eremiobacteraeota bacterium]
MENSRPVYRPQIDRPAAVPTLVRVPRDSQLFRGWGITL